ncbi:glycosyltransferase family 2 protein [Actinomycetospora termitidis]|uniref:Glycosyltransferase family 2 protein n=1 Tax=Actinomycetospora termitidis TaxID=3053470 RepID=A0ABT7M3T8_9PSEU|nr:glycosyltransferase family 2 protein [Actinomycetospora sp. Odt1-22]MDL5154677.1 glycosyltransferase family 2 protein [Actinomycetospora sp. Odt1-22]
MTLAAAMTTVPGSQSVGSLLVVLPALNEADSIGRVVAEVRSREPAADLLVVDDGSIDRTADVARAAGARVMALPFNLGVGGAMRAAYRFAYEEGYSCVVQVDADGQHDPADIGRLRTALTEADVVVGARFAGTGGYVVRGPRRWAMRLLASTLSRLVRTPLTDPTSGFRMVNERALALFAFDFPEEYLGDTVEALVLASRAKLRIAQVPVAMRERTAGTPSQNAFRSCAYLVRVVTAIFLAVARRAPIVRPGSVAEASA